MLLSDWFRVSYSTLWNIVSVMLGEEYATILFPGLMEDARLYHGTFSDDFIWGVGTSSYQIEGGWNADGKIENIWDKFVHAKNSKIKDGSTGDISCDFYHKYEEDVLLIKQLGVSHFRISISWSRLFTNSDMNKVNENGIKYYNNVINSLLKHGIQPLVTLFHWDLPQFLEDEGGWLNEGMVDHFEKYARTCFKSFGDRVKMWATINDPATLATATYEHSAFPSNQKKPEKGKNCYTAANNMLKAHARAWHVYNDEFRAAQGGTVSISLGSNWFEPKSDLKKDKDASQKALEFSLGWFADPIFSKKGNYPYSMRDSINANSRGDKPFRLPVFDAKWIKYIKGTSDYFFLNHYTSRLVEKSPAHDGSSFSLSNDQGYIESIDPAWENTTMDFLKIAPTGMRKILNWVKERYNNYPVIITENGCCDDGGVADNTRIHFFKAYINELLKSYAIDKCNVKGYFAWTLFDNFEWDHGYSQKFGFYELDFESPNRPRTAKNSAKMYSELIKNNGFV